ncbi:MAG: DinB family protein [Bacteroidetes bacterium]|nr:DinB family protein [Bacteroidota bacterium]
MPSIKWTSREFIFDFPPGNFPFILERLYGTAARIEEMTKNSSLEILRKKNNNSWSILEHIGHLIGLDELHDGRIDDFTSEKKELRPADMTNKKTQEADHNKRDLAELIKEFREERLKFISRLKKLSPAQSALHPRLKKNMRVVDMAYFIAEHDDHHLSIIRELINS